MKFASVVQDGRRNVVWVDSEAKLAWPVSGLLPASEIGDGSDMVLLIRALPNGSAPLRPIGVGTALDKLVIEAPLANPPHNLLCVGKNYHEHAKEFTKSGYDSSANSAADAIPSAPIIFTKASNTISGPDSVIPLHAGLDAQVDYEAELAVVIGKAGRGIRKQDAMDYVWGYTVVNDVTARDAQARHKQWFLGKSLDGYCPMGPWIVTADELNGANLQVRCTVNGELRQNASTKDLIFDIPTLIETISAGITLEPGDVICTGTPAGVGIGFNPPRFLRQGDLVEVEIQGIGKISNRVESAAASRPAKAPAAIASPSKSTGAAVPLVLDEIGQGPAVLMVHGLGGSSNTWYPQMAELSSHYSLLVPDLHGAGRTPEVGSLSIESHVEALLQLLAQRGITKVDLLGHSMGSMICQHLAVRAPSLVRSLVLIGPIHEPAAGARDALKVRAQKARAEGMQGIANTLVTAATSSDTQRHLPSASAFVRESLMRQAPEGYARNCEALAQGVGVDASKVACPTLLLTGDEDKTAPLEAMTALTSRIAGARSHVIAGCGHWATIERARQVNSYLSDFLAQGRTR